MVFLQTLLICYFYFLLLVLRHLMKVKGNRRVLPHNIMSSHWNKWGSKVRQYILQVSANFGVVPHTIPWRFYPYWHQSSSKRDRKRIKERQKEINLLQRESKRGRKWSIFIKVRQYSLISSWNNSRIKINVKIGVVPHTIPWRYWKYCDVITL